MEPWAAVVVGIIAGFSYCLTSYLTYRANIDDPRDSIGGKYLFLYPKSVNP